MREDCKYYKWLADDLLEVEIVATSPEQARQQRDAVLRAIEEHDAAVRPMIVPRDRLERNPELYRQRLEAHRGRFRSVFARKCTISRIDSPLCGSFMDSAHSYGRAKARFNYGIFSGGELVGAAQFSSARKWNKGGREIRSYEWVRYASLPDVRIVGGMGKVLEAFIRDVKPDDIMSYADLEWSDGQVYSRLGFELEGTTEPVLFGIDKSTWERIPVKKNDKPTFYFLNFGSNKYRLKLTQY